MSDDNTWEGRMGSRAKAEPKIELVEVRWRLRAQSGRILECGLYMVSTGIEVRMGFAGDHLLYSELKPHIDAARAVADDLKCHVRHEGTKPLRKVYFPYAFADQGRDEFSRNVLEQYPYLATENALLDVLMRAQHFEGASQTWMPQFMDITNVRKHRSLGDQVPVRVSMFLVIQWQFDGKLQQLIFTRPFTVGADGPKIGGYLLPPGIYGPDNPPPLPPAFIVSTGTQSRIVFKESNEEVSPFLETVTEGVASIVESLLGVDRTNEEQL